MNRIIPPCLRPAIWPVAVLLMTSGLAHGATARRPPGFAVIRTQAIVAASDAAAGSLRPVERSFIVQSAENGRDEAELSRLAVSQAAGSEIRTFAQQLVTDCNEITRALETLARRKSLELPIQPTSFSDRYRELAAQSGGAFDRAFVREVTARSSRALRLCEAAVANAKDTDVRDIAGALLPMLREHVNKTTELEKSL